MVEQPNLDRILVCEEVNDLERMCDNADSQELLAIVATLHHQTERIYSEFQEATRVFLPTYLRGVQQ